MIASAGKPASTSAVGDIPESEGKGKPSAAFYVTGGSLPADAPSYVARRADQELLEALRQGEFCYVLDTRQVGKSSLLVRTAQRLRAEGQRVVALDLSATGQNITPEQWYFGLLYSLSAQLGREEEMEAFWETHSALGPAQRWMAAVQEVALEQTDGGGSAAATDPAPLVILIDETDSVRSLPFSADEFFALVRECYNRRTRDASLRRLTFCLVGVATPAQLIRDTRTTPFNIGRRIALTDFTHEEAVPLEQGLRRPGALNTTSDSHLLARILFWTGGHPYLTQRLCQALVQEQPAARSAADVDRLCAATYLTRQGRETDPNLTFARDRLLSSGNDEGIDTVSVLALFDKVRNKRFAPVRYDPTDPRADILRLAGVVKVSSGLLVVRNRLYARAFDRRWIKANLPGEELRRQRRALWRGALRASLFWALLLVAAFLVLYQSRQARMSRDQASWELQERKRAETKAQSLARNLTRLEFDLQKETAELARITVRRGEAEAQLKEVRALQTRAEAALSGAKQQAAFERERSRQSATRVDAMSGEIASAFSAVSETGATALEYGLRAVETALQQKRRPPQAAVDGLTRAVDASLFRRLVLSHQEGVLSAVFSPDRGRILTATKGAYAYLWDARTGQRLHRITVQKYPKRREFINAAEFSFDGKYLLTAADQQGTVTLWAAQPKPGAAPRVLRILQRSQGKDSVSVCYAEFSRDGRFVAALAGGNEVRLHDLQARTSRLLGMAAKEKHTGYLWTVSFSHDGTRVVTAGSDGTARVWDVATGRCLALLDRHLDPDASPDLSRGVTSARFERYDELVVTTGQDRMGRLWDWKRGFVYRKMYGNQDWVWNGYFSDGGEMVATTSKDGTVQIWATRGDNVPLHVLKTHAAAQVFTARFSSNGREIVTAGDDRTAQVWSFTNRAFLATGTTISHAEFSPDGKRVLMTASDKSLRVFSTERDQEQVIAWLGDWALHGSFSPDGRHVATVDRDFHIRLYDLTRVTDRNPALIWQSEQKAGGLEKKTKLFQTASLSFSPDGARIACAGPGYFASVFDAASGKPVWTRAFVGRVACAVFHPDGRQVLLAAADNRVELVDAKTGQMRRLLALPGRRIEPEDQHMHGPTSGAVSADGRLIAVGDSAHAVFLFDAVTGRLRTRFTAHSEAVTSVDFSADGRRLSTAGADRTVRIWNVAELLGTGGGESSAPPRPLLTLRGQPGPVRSVRFSPDGQWLITGSADNAARIFPATLEGYVRRAHQILALLGRRSSAASKRISHRKPYVPDNSDGTHNWFPAPPRLAAPGPMAWFREGSQPRLRVAAQKGTAATSFVFTVWRIKNGEKEFVGNPEERAVGAEAVHGTFLGTDSTGEYEWTAHAVVNNFHGPEQVRHSRFVVNKAPHTPLPLAPSEGERIMNLPVTLRWRTAQDPYPGPRRVRYAVVVRRVSDGWQARTPLNYAATEWTVSVPGPGEYLWKVVAGDGLDSSLPSRELRFSVELPPKEKPALVPFTGGGERTLRE